jgi:REP element-mobilizing transposase RayT
MIPRNDVKNLNEQRRRRSIRLQNYDYSKAGTYYITVCTRNRELLFGDVVRGQMQINEVGRIVETVWLSLPQFYAGIELDGFIIMPNHVHGIVIIRSGVGAIHESPLRKDGRCPLGSAGVCCCLK